MKGKGPWTYDNTYLTVVGEAGNEVDYFNMAGGPVIPEPAGLVAGFGVAVMLRGRRRRK